VSPSYESTKIVFENKVLRKTLGLKGKEVRDQGINRRIILKQILEK
jgi:hypothetical protein